MTVVDEKGSLKGEEGFLKVFRDALATSGIEASRFPVGLAVSVNANGDVMPVARSMPFLPAFSSLCVGKVKKLRAVPHVEHDHGHHRVQFYEKGSFICDKVVEFLCPVLLGNGGVVVIAVPEHRERLERSFLAQGCLVDRLKHEGRLVMLDAVETLSQFMVDGQPVVELFDNVIKALVKDMSGKFKSVLAYGEMVNVLCEQQNPLGAIELEKLWNNLLREYSFTLMCGYSMSNFGSHTDKAAFREICQLHTDARPTEEFNELANSKTQAGVVLELQQQARALATEVELKEALRQQMTLVAQVQKELAEQELLVKLAHQARQNQQEFLATICHDIRNPLHVVYGVVDCLAEEGERLKEVAEKVVLESDGPERLLAIRERIKQNVAALEKCANQQMIVLNDALDLAKMENNMLEMNAVDFALVQTVTSWVQMFEPHFQQKRLKKVVELPGEEMHLRADVNRLTQVLNNLVTNAIKFTPEDGIITICVKCEAVGKEVELLVEVADTGIGMSPEEMAHVWKRYKQGGPEITLLYGGTGLGLAICKKLVELLGGTISVQSTKGVGSRFSFSIPCESGASPGQENSKSSVSPEIRIQQAAKAAVRGKNVLIVEDNKILQRFLVSYLEPLGCRYQVANDGIEALECHAGSEWHLIFMDFEMPRMKGTEATRVIREREKASGKRAVIIGLSANAMSSDLLTAQNAGMDAYLTKPFHREELYEAITKFDLLARQSLHMTEESFAALATMSQKLTLFSRKPSRAGVADTKDVPADGALRMVFEIDTNFTYVSFDAVAKQEMLEVFGKEVRVGMNVFEATSHRPEVRDQVVTIWKRALLGESLTIQQEFKLPGNEPVRLYEITYKPKKDAAEKTVGARCVVQRIPLCHRSSSCEEKSMMCP